MNKTARYSLEVRELAMQLVFEGNPLDNNGARK